MVASSLGVAKTVLSAADIPPGEVLFGTTANMQNIRSRIEAAAPTGLPLLIRGEAGTGKGVIAKLLHLKSLWSRGPFVEIRCSAVPGGVIESELFGYEKGTFAGADGNKPGRVKNARLGTLYLGEIGALDRGLQDKLLRVLQNSQFCRIGCQPDRTMEVRLVSTTNRDLENDTRTGAFREDLLDRLNGLSITMPPLRERREDIPGLIEHLCARYNKIFNRHTPALSSSAIHVLQNYHWPGNIRELENVLRRYVILGQERLAVSDVSGHSEFVFIPDLSMRSDLALKSITRQVKRELERKLILRALEENQWNRRRAASALKISYRALLYKIRGSGIPSLRGLASPLRARSANDKGLDAGGSPPKAD